MKSSKRGGIKMKPFKTKFQRVETKFMLSEETYQALLIQLNTYMRPNVYAHSTITNLYYDTPTYQMIRWSIEKPDYKEKIRVRSYEGVPNKESQVFAEVKKKFQKVVYKRRIYEQLQAVQAFFEGEEDALADSQVKNELAYMKKQYGQLQLMMYIYYDRYSLQGREDEGVRITFDSNLIYRDYDLDLEKGIYGETLLPEGYRLMEVKISGAYPLWLSHILSSLNIYKSSFSKYGAAYKEVKKRGELEYGQYAI